MPVLLDFAERLVSSRHKLGSADRIQQCQHVAKWRPVMRLRVPAAWQCIIITWVSGKLLQYWQQQATNPSSTGGSGHHLVHSFLAHLSKCHKWHLHRFIYFCRAYGCDQQTCTERHTQKPQNTGNNRLHCMLCTAIWPSNNKFFDILPSNSSWHSYPSWLMHIKHIFCHCYQCAININAKMFTTIHLSAHP